MFARVSPRTPPPEGSLHSAPAAASAAAILLRDRLQCDWHGNIVATVVSFHGGTCLMRVCPVCDLHTSLTLELLRNQPTGDEAETLLCTLIAQVLLTEEETEYSVVAVKYVFDAAIALQFTCSNTVAEQILENVTVAVDLADAVR